MNLLVSKTTSPTEEEWDLIRQGKMIKRMSKANWSTMLAQKKAVSKIVKAVLNSKPKPTTSFKSLHAYSGKNSPEGSIMYA